MTSIIRKPQKSRQLSRPMYVVVFQIFRVLGLDSCPLKSLTGFGNSFSFGVGLRVLGYRV